MLNKNVLRIFFLSVSLVFCIGVKIFAADVTVAVLDFDANVPGTDKLGSQLAEMVTTLLSANGNVTIVERGELQKALQEQELSLTGLVDSEKAVQVGRLVGAKILITGKAFVMGKSLFITGKLIGVETSLVEGVLVKAAISDDLGELAVQLCEKIMEKIEGSEKLLPRKADSEARILELAKILENRKKPTIAVLITESHIERRTAAPAVPDPAVETEVKNMLLKCGFEIKKINPTEVNKPNREIAYLVTGEAFSEFGQSVGNLRSCVARAEVELHNTTTGKIDFSDRQVCRAADLAENIAGKTALQKTGKAIGLRLLEYFAKTLPKKG